MRKKIFFCTVFLLFFIPPAQAATYTVTNTDDSGGGSLRQAILDANANSGADIIDFSVSGTITLNSAFPHVTDSLTITGPGAASLTVDGNSNQLFFFADPLGSQTHTMYGLTLTGGTGSSGFGGAISLFQSETLTLDSCIISGNTAAHGGGIYSWSSTLTVKNSRISDNEATTEGGGISIDGTSRTFIDNSTIMSNRAVTGGGIYDSGSQLQVTNTTISGNGPSNSGGGIYTNTGGLFHNVTISGNSANVGGGISNAISPLLLFSATLADNTGISTGSGLYNSGSVTLKNTIVTNNLGAGSSCVNTGGGTLTSNGYNLDSGNSCGFIHPDDLTNTDPLLGPLYENGGPTRTHALLSHSPAIDSGGYPGFGGLKDQRGFARPQDGDGDETAAWDMGAFEVFTGRLELPQTGQTGCWDRYGTLCTCGKPGCRGHDGSMRAGIAWPEPRFTASGDCVTDTLTGLLWMRSPQRTLRTWEDALSYANEVVLCGYDDWRLPNINEFESLVNMNAAPNTWLLSKGFADVFYHYWSSTTSIAETNRAWYVYMVDGGIGYASYTKTNNWYAWPVRGGQQDRPDTNYPANLLKTGQTVSYSPMDDGTYQRGITLPASGRFSDHSDGTVTDNLTGLMWLKDANCMETHYSSAWPSGYVFWQEGLDIVKGINDGTYIDCSAGYADWRMPNRKELHSLTDFSQSNPALPLDHPFENVQFNFPPGWQYLTSTTYANKTDQFWGLRMGTGTIAGTQKASNTNWLWPVRGGLTYPVSPFPWHLFVPAATGGK